MHNHTGILGQTSKLLPFLRPDRGSLPAESAMPIPPAPAPLPRLVPVLVPIGAKAVALTRLSPTAALAHDARNALCSLSMLSGLLNEPGVLHAPHAHLAADLESVTNALTGLVDQLANLRELPPSGAERAKTAHGSQSAETPHRRAKSAGEALKDSIRLLRSIAGAHVEVHISAESALPPVEIDEDALLRVLMNLVKNSSEAMPSGGTVHIVARRALSRTSPAVLIHVSDNGPGIPAHALDHIFEPGFSSKRHLGTSQEASGLGLSIVRELVEASGGEVRVASTRKRGTTFELKLPCPKPGL